MSWHYKKYHIEFCHCGRIHFIPYDTMSSVCEIRGKELLFICNNCGRSFVKGLNPEVAGDKTWYRKEVVDTEHSGDKVGLVIASHGTPVPMRSGGQATAMSENNFYDAETSKPKGYSSHDWETVCKSVNTGSLINNVGDADKLMSLRRYPTSIDWRGTAFL